MPESITPTEPAPSAVEPQAPYWLPAPFLARAQAAGVDMLIVVFLSIPAVLVFVPALNALLADYYDGADRGDIGVSLGVWLTATVYLAVLQGRRGSRNGQTLGKQQQDIRVIGPCGMPVGRTRVWLRGAFVALLLPVGQPVQGLLVLGHVEGAGEWGQKAGAFVLGVAVATVALSTRRRAFYDPIFGTTVVEALIVDRGEADERLRALPVRTVPRAPVAAVLAIVWMIAAVADILHARGPH